MKILKIHFKNLNSLVGEWEIDLTHPEYVTEGIFAITGPTGAGKTTILDALCLALYGRTPRLKDVSASTNEIMSRQTGECFAEVTFETARGRFRSSWSQRRAHGKPTGALQQAKVSFLNLADSSDFAAKTKEVAERIHEETGMSFEQFTRSMLLAQGGFSAFLQASSRDRGELLEQLTGTQIYSDISRQVFAVYKEERKRCDELQQARDACVVLDPETEEQKRQQLTRETGELERLNTGKKRIEEALSWLAALARLEDAYRQALTEAQALAEEEEAFRPKKAMLETSRSARTAEADYRTLCEKRRLRDQAVSQENAEQKKLPGILERMDRAGKACEEASRNLEAQRERQETELALIREIMRLDQTRAQLMKECDEKGKRVKDLTSLLQRKSRELQNEKKKKDTLSKEHAAVTTYLKENSEDARIREVFSLLKETDARFSQAGVRIREAEDRQKSHAAALAEARKKASAAQKTVTELQKRVQEITDERARIDEAVRRILQDRTVEELEEERRAHERVVQERRTIASLEEHRKHLVDGSPCPLCGALEHPYATGSIPDVSEEEKAIQALDRQLKELRDLSSSRDRLQNRQTRAMADQMTALQVQNDADDTVQRVMQELQHAEEQVGLLQKEQDETGAVLRETLAPFGVLSMLGDRPDFAPLLAELERRMRLWKANEEKETQLAADIRSTEASIAGLEDTVRQQTEQVAHETEGLTSVQTECAAKDRERFEKFRKKDPEEEEQKLKDAAERALKTEKSAREALERLRQEEAGLRAALETIRETVRTRTDECTAAEAAFSGILRTLGFADEAHFAEALLPIDEQRSLEKTEEDLRRRRIDITARTEERKRACDAEREKRITEESREELEKLGRTTDEEIQKYTDSVSRLKLELHDNEKARQDRLEKEEQFRRQEKEAVRWERLNTLIGSSDGKQYRDFAQGLTFALMIRHANRKLMHMTDRYILKASMEGRNSLDIHVIDTYQAGLERSTRNLSGGESFLISLALALGLSQMASRTVPVDSLFLDEGFGTLDETTLETALDTLASLRQSGRTIGVISHIAALKDRISTQIQVVPVQRGRSRILGCGCREVTEKN